MTTLQVYTRVLPTIALGQWASLSPPPLYYRWGFTECCHFNCFHLAFCNKINICKNRYVKNKTKKTLQYVKIQLVLTMEARIKKNKKVIPTFYLINVRWDTAILTFFPESHDINLQLQDIKSELWYTNSQLWLFIRTAWNKLRILTFFSQNCEI